MSSAPRVVIEDTGVDVAYVPPDGPHDAGVLFVRPGQSYESAVASAGRVLPALHPNAVRELLRGHLASQALDVESLLAPDAPARRALRRERAELPRATGGRYSGTAMVISAVMGAVFAIGGSLAAGVLPLEPEPVNAFTSDGFLRFERAVGWDCSPMSELTAACTTPTDETLLASAAVMYDGVVYAFEGGVMVVAFNEADRADTAVRTFWGPTRPAGERIVTVGRYMVRGPAGPGFDHVLEAVRTLPESGADLHEHEHVSAPPSGSAPVRM